MSKRKAPAESAGKDVNGDIMNMLQELSEYEKNVSRNIHKAKAYRKAVAEIALLPTRLKSGDEAKALPGIGKKIGEKIDEFLSTGKLRKLDDISKDETNIALKTLTRVMGIGPAKAKEFFDKGVRTLDDLRAREASLTHQQRIGLKYVDEFEERVPRTEVAKLEERVKDAAKSLSEDLHAVACGSYRRGAESSGDIDILLTKTGVDTESPKEVRAEILKNFVHSLESIGFVTDCITLGPSKFMGVCKLDKSSKPRRIDVRFFPDNEFHCAKLYFTGSDIFNSRMRARALEMGYTLNEYSLRPFDRSANPGEPVLVKCEEDIFDYIFMPYVPPEHRNA